VRKLQVAGAAKPATSGPGNGEPLQSVKTLCAEVMRPSITGLKRMSVGDCGAWGQLCVAIQGQQARSCIGAGHQ